ncbi:MAG TPA: MBL fold metallo-hydrolase [Terriglobales bacterium]|nr:MBL fold metallo-hydrolase [Terriglobales bacterium]
MSNEPQIRLKFWGVRGSIPVAAYDFLGCGGNTTCVELRINDSVLIIDAGTGIRKLGMELQRELAGKKLSVDLLLTHFHWDHIQGLPFFTPLYSPESEVRFYSTRPASELRELLEGEMAHPYFPVSFELLPAKRGFIDVSKDPISLSGVRVRPFPMNHPQGATGYRIEVGSRVITHASDLEHGNPEFDKILREYAQGSDVLIYDAQFTPDEYPMRKGWGHSTWLEATRVAQECNVKRLMLFHHDPGHEDAMMIDIVAQARKCFEKTQAAQEGMEIIL